MANLRSIVTECPSHSGQFITGFSQHGAALGLVDRVFDPIDPDRFRLTQFLRIIRSERLRMLAQRFQPQRLERGEIGFADLSDRNIVGQRILLPTLLNGAKRMSTLFSPWFNSAGGLPANRRSER